MEHNRVSSADNLYGSVILLEQFPHNHSTTTILPLPQDTMPMLNSSTFAGEPYLRVPLPRYEDDWALLNLQFAVVLLVFWILVPLVGIYAIRSKSHDTNKPKGQASSHVAQTKESVSVMTLPALRSMVTFMLVATLVSCGYVWLTVSPANYITARGVFEAPFFTEYECQAFLERVQAVTERNIARATASINSNDTTTVTNTEKDALLLREPRGWQKDRHKTYLTTDLNLVTDPFTHEDRQWLAQHLQNRLATILSRLYGIPLSSIRANDLFVVRYDAASNDNNNISVDDNASSFRNHLDIHTDSGHISFNVLLNEDFEGGGTRFWQRQGKDEEVPFITMKPRVGDMIFHSASLRHEGLPITKGTRLILVGFLSVDRLWMEQQETKNSNAQKGEVVYSHTGLSWYSSWLSLPWLSIQLGVGERIARQGNAAGSSRDTTGRGSASSTAPGTSSAWKATLYGWLSSRLQILADLCAVHHATVLVSPHDRTVYLSALDEAAARAAAQKSTERHRSSRWFSGQHLTLNIDGTIHQEWEERQKNRHRYDDEL